MKRHVGLLWIIGAIAWSCNHSATAGTVYGPSGLILNPSAYVPPDESFGLGVSTFKIGRGEPGPGGGDPRWVSSTLDFGVGGKGEVGLTYLHASAGGSGDGIGGFAKYQFHQEDANTPAMAVGLDFIGGDLETRQAYVAASKRLSPPEAKNPFTLTAGVIRVDARDGIPTNDTDFFGGFDLKLTRRMGLVAEWRSRTEGHPKSGSGAMLTYAGQRYGIGVGAINNGLSDNHQFFIGVGFNVSTLD